MSFVIQQPGSASLLDAVNDAAGNATAGGALFAFASRSGVESFFSQPNVIGLLNQGAVFHLIVGIDAITNADALFCLTEKCERYPGALRAEVFMHQSPLSTFHPKFIWFGQAEEVRLITGSGNLTLRGLGQQSDATPASGNWEAFTVQCLSGNDAGTVAQTIQTWVEAQRAAGHLYRPDDERLQTRAMNNSLLRYAPGSVDRTNTTHDGGQPHGAVEQGVRAEDPEVGRYDVLVQELPKNRPGQADVGKLALTIFFGYDNAPKDVLIQPVSLSGELGSVHHQLLFKNASINYRLELRAARPLSYEIGPNDERMIVVAVKLGESSFRYSIVPINDPQYDSVSALLGPVSNTGRRNMRQKFFTTNELRVGWPGVPESLLPVVLPTPEP